MIRVTCPTCQFDREYANHLIGWEIACQRCRASLRVETPAPAASQPAVVDFGWANGVVRFALGVVGGLLALGFLAASVATLSICETLLGVLRGDPEWKHPATWLMLGGCVLTALVCLGGASLIGRVMPPAPVAKTTPR